MVTIFKFLFNKSLYRTSWTDMVFEGKNKEYGAYSLRQIYDKNITNAIIGTFTVFIVLFVAPGVIKRISEMMNPPEEVVEEVMKEVELLPPPPIEPPDPTEPPPPPAPKVPPPPKLPPTVKYVPPKVVEDEEVQVEEEIATVEELEDANAGTETVEGDPDALDEFVILDEYGEDDLIVEEEEQIFEVVEQDPEFPGGLQSMMKFIKQNYKKPRKANELGISGRIFVQFVVDKSGTIKNVSIAKGIGHGCDEEAVRVLKMMPKWVPGKQNGRAVSVKYMVPIRVQ